MESIAQNGKDRGIIKRKGKIYCEDCCYRVSHKTAVGICWYCKIHDVSEVSDEIKYTRGRNQVYVPIGWGCFSGNKEGNCPKYKQRGLFKRLFGD